MKNRSNLLAAALLLVTSLASVSCKRENVSDSTIRTSYELTRENPYDTVNVTVNWLKQGKWIEMKNGVRDTNFYRNDTLIQQP